jgi:hypothetical protein
MERIEVRVKLRQDGGQNPNAKVQMTIEIQMPKCQRIPVCPLDFELDLTSELCHSAFQVLEVFYKAR